MGMMKSMAAFGIVLIALLTAGGTVSAQSQPAPATMDKTVLIAPPPPPAARMSAAECEVWNRERSFAASVERHDVAAFADHVHEQAVFGAGSPVPTHGRFAIIADWKGIVDGKTFKLRWSPGVVTIGGNGSLAISRGPSWMEDLRPGTNREQRYSIGAFNSTWIKDSDGQWRVLFDSGEPTHPASAEDVAKLVASLPKECPQAAK